MQSPTNACAGQATLARRHTADFEQAKILASLHKYPQICPYGSNQYSRLVLACSDMIIVPVAAYATSPGIIRLFVLGNEILDGLNVLLLRLLRAQVLEFSPLVVL